jgi:2-polyprenyl-6-methoxyphenol hydroxylase-like FAD-dependent oxidoreductase
MSSPKVAIVGAGPGGLTLAVLLQKYGIPFTVYEKDLTSEFRSQGGSLDIHADSGQVALKEAGLFEQFKAAARAEDQGFRLYDKKGAMWINQVADDTVGEEYKGRPEIDRTQLRNILLNAVNPHNIEWGRKVTSVSERPEGKVDLSFEGHPTVTADLVVGADGTWSRIRPFLTETRPEYTSVTMVEVDFADVDTRQPSISNLVGRGMIIAGSYNKALTAQRNGLTGIRSYITLRVPETWTTDCGIDFSNPTEARKQFLSIFDDWGDDLKELISLCDDSFIPRASYAMPIGHTWTSRKNVTVIGDAAHVMSPFAGEGVNLAMSDALNLARGLAKYKSDVASAIKEYESEMFERVKELAWESANNMEMILAEDSPKGFFDIMSKFMPPDSIVAPK